MPVPALFVGSGLAQYGGAALAVGLFPVVAPIHVAWLRLVVAAIIMMIWRAPWRRSWTRQSILWSLVFGVALAGMNISFYAAISYLPLGTAVAIEFMGPVAVAAITGRGIRERGAMAVAALGVALLAGVSVRTLGGAAVLGLVCIGIAAGCWAAYIVLGRRVAHTGGVDSLALAMAGGAIVSAPWLGASALSSVAHWQTALTILGVAVMSSVVPYAVEQLVLRRVTAATFSVLLALLPATAVVVGAVVLQQWPTPVEWVGLAAVSGAIMMTAPS